MGGYHIYVYNYIYVHTHTYNQYTCCISINIYFTHVDGFPKVFDVHLFTLPLTLGSTRPNDASAPRGWEQN